MKRYATAGRRRLTTQAPLRERPAPGHHRQRRQRLQRRGPRLTVVRGRRNHRLRTRPARLLCQLRAARAEKRAKQTGLAADGGRRTLATPCPPRGRRVTKDQPWKLWMLMAQRPPVPRAVGRDSGRAVAAILAPGSPAAPAPQLAPDASPRTQRSLPSNAARTPPLPTAGCPRRTAHDTATNS